MRFDSKLRDARVIARLYPFAITYRITGLDPLLFAPLYGLSDEALGRHGAMRMSVTDRPGFPCRIRVDDAEVGESVLLLNHVSHDVANPYRARHAIFVTEGSLEPADVTDALPPALERRILSLRAFDAAGMMSDAVLAQPGEADTAIRRLFEAPETAYLHAHNAIRGCFAARVDRA